MKKLLYILFALLAMTGCNKNQTPDNPPTPDPQWVGEGAELQLMKAVYCGQENIIVEGSQVEHELFFYTDGLTYEGGSEFSGTGEVVRIYTITDRVDGNFFPSTGTYNVTNTFDPMTIVRGYDPNAGTEYEGQLVGGSIVINIVDGMMVNYQFIYSGTVEIQGTAENCFIQMKLMDKTATDRTYYYTGALNITNGTTSAEEKYALEPDAASTLTRTGTGVTLTLFREEDVFYCDMETQDYAIYTYVSMLNDDDVTGHFTVGSTIHDADPGIVRRSDGYHDGVLYLSYAAQTDNLGNTDMDKPVYFITGGSMDVTPVDEANNIYNVQMNFTTYKGSTLTFSYEGVCNVVYGN